MNWLRPRRLNDWLQGLLVVWICSWSKKISGKRGNLNKPYSLVCSIIPMLFLFILNISQKHHLLTWVKCGWNLPLSVIYFLKIWDSRSPGRPWLGYVAENYLTLDLLGDWKPILLMLFSTKLVACLSPYSRNNHVDARCSSSLDYFPGF